jgi:trehalose 6-phosphate synthase/phosphatase
MGGLATGLRSFYKSYKSIWIGWPGILAESIQNEKREKIELDLLSEHQCIPLFLSRGDIKNFYHGFCNKTIWPLFHYFPNSTVYNENLWQTYKRVNEKFCDLVIQHANTEDTIWIHDYQLLLLPNLLREKLPRVKIGFFLHIPFPSFEIFRILPWRKEILEGMCGSDLIGFHTYDYVRHFLSSVRRLLGYEHTIGQLFTEKRVVRADIFPMGINYDQYKDASKDEQVRREISRIEKKLGDRKIILSVDRLDYTKGIIHRLRAFDHFLKHHSEYHGKVTLVLVAVPSRTSVDTYVQLKKELDEYIGRINGKYGHIGWVPVWYFYRALPFHTLTALYALSDVALITPLRDGMNLIAKEYIATRGDRGGTLVLSGMAGAAHELSESLIVNPHNIEQVAAAIQEALEMPMEEENRRNSLMQSRLKRYDVVRWAQDFIERLDAVFAFQKSFYERRLTATHKKKLVDQYKNAKRRLLLLDYDGTLVSFASKPGGAAPDAEIIEYLSRLSKRNEIVMVSGRERKTLIKWFGSLNIGLIAEHGVWLREKSTEWHEVASLRDDWKDEVRPILELYMDRTPGTLIEEKTFSLVWHYRMADPDLAMIRANELKETLINLTENLNIGILEGNKLIEVKTAGITKGNAALHWISRKDWDFILAIGDDVTDEDTFGVLPKDAYSLKVGLGLSKARFNVLEVSEVRQLLKELSAA